MRYRENVNGMVPIRSPEWKDLPEDVQKRAMYRIQKLSGKSFIEVCNDLNDELIKIHQEDELNKTKHSKKSGHYKEGT